MVSVFYIPYLSFQVATIESLEFDKNRDLVYGLQNFGVTATPDIANHQLVFAIEFIDTGEHFPLSYMATRDAASSTHLARAIKDHVRLLRKGEFEVTATVCDQGGPNRKAIRNLIEETNAERFRKHGPHARPCKSDSRSLYLYFLPCCCLNMYINNISTGTRCFSCYLNYKKMYRNVKYCIFFCTGTTSFEIDGYLIIHLWDPPHLEKNCRNNYMHKYLAYILDGEKKFVHIWTVIILAYKMDLILNPLNRRLPKITEAHVIESKCPKMRVMLAAQVCSRTYADWIRELAETGSKNQ